MGGIFEVGRVAGVEPVAVRRAYPLCNSLSGSTAIYPGDVVVGTRNTTLMDNPAEGTGVRRLLAADKTANYLQGGVAVGVLGIAADGYTTSSTGLTNGNPTFSTLPQAVQFQAVNEAAVSLADPQYGRSMANVIGARQGVRFMGRVNINTTTYASGLRLTSQLNGTRAGLILTANGNETIYSIDTAAAAADQILQIVEAYTGDPNYNRTVTGTDTAANNALADALRGPLVIFEFLSTYCQIDNGAVYTSN